MNGHQEIVLAYMTLPHATAVPNVTRLTENSETDSITKDDEGSLGIPVFMLIYAPLLFAYKSCFGELTLCISKSYFI